MQTEEICIYAVQKSDSAIRWIKNQTLAVRKAAILAYPEAIKYINFCKYDYTVVESKDECPICYDDDKNKDEFCKINRCGHVFHTECIKKCFVDSNNHKCPFCKQNVCIY